MNNMQHKRMTRKHREIVRRIVVKGLLTLQSPTCLGSGDSESMADLAIVRDSVSQKALLTGASLAGALRNYLRDYERDYNASESTSDWATALFGGIRGDDDGEQSPLIVYDAISRETPTIELRDGVVIDSETGTAKGKGKYDLELLAAGTTFPIQFELMIDRTFVKTPEQEEQLIAGLAIVLNGLESGEVGLGTKKRRGFGCCQVSQWAAQTFDMTKAQGIRDWLNYDHWSTITSEGLGDTPSIAKKLNIDLGKFVDRRNRLKINATFELASPMLIRSGELEAKAAPDTVHLKSYRDGKAVPVISGSSLAGVLRHRAGRIVNTLGIPIDLIDTLFGFVNEDAEAKPARASRLIVSESEIKLPDTNGATQNPSELVQTRIAVDRFTGGAYSGALFQEQPVFDSGHPQTEVVLEVRSPKHCEVGLLLLLLKDLWTEDLPVGGTSSIGRGRLRGKTATLEWQGTEPQHWKIEQLPNRLKVSNPSAPDESESSVRARLEAYVQALNDCIEEKEAAS